MPAIELKTSEIYHRHKRNLLLLDSATIILGLAAPSEIKIPGLPTDVAIRAELAFIVLLVSLIYAALSFAVEARVVATRNSQEGMDAATDLDQKFAAAGARLDEQARQIEAEMVSLREGVEELRKTANVMRQTSGELGARAAVHLQPLLQPSRPGTIGAIPIEPTDERLTLILPEINAALAPVVRAFDESTTGIEGAVARREAAIATIADKLAEIASTNDTLRQRFAQLSRSIYRSQRLGFRWLDIAAPVALTAIAGLICVSEIMRGFGS